MTKKFEFISNAAKRAFLDLPKGIQLQFSNDLNAVASDKRPFSNFKDISNSVGKGAIELIENGRPAYRAVYCAKYLDTVYILHAFTKTTNGVDKKAMATASKRYKDMIAEVQKKEKELKQSTTPSKKPRKNKKKK
jgi:phage-related protein